MNSFILRQSDYLVGVFEPYLSIVGDPLASTFAPFYALVDQIDAVLHLTPNVIVFLLCSLLAFPLGLIHRKLPVGTARHAYSAAIGLAFSFLTFQWFALHSVVCALVAYVSMRLLPIRWSVRFTFVFAFAYLSACHFYRMAVDYLGWSMDFTAIQMLVTLKAISVPFNVLDGKRRDKDSLEPSQRALSIDRVPSLLEFLGFIFFYPTVFSGPVIEMKHYLDYSNQSVDHPKDTPAVLQRVALAVIAAALNLLVTPMFPASLLKEPVLSSVSYFTAYLYALLVVMMLRPKYYVAWYLGEAAAINAGFGYSGVDAKTGKKLWKNVEQAKMFSVELGTNMFSMVNMWNIGVSKWLRHYVYCRIGPKPEPGKRGSKTLNTFATFTISAFWHGFYPGYYLFWLAAALLSEIGKELHRKVRPLFYSPGKATPMVVNIVYKTIGWLMTHFALNYSAVGFVLLSWSDTVHFYNRVGWGGHVVFVLVYVVLSNFVKRPRPSTPAKEGDASKVAVLEEDTPPTPAGYGEPAPLRARTRRTKKD